MLKRSINLILAEAHSIPGSIIELTEVSTYTFPCGNEADTRRDEVTGRDYLQCCGKQDCKYCGKRWNVPPSTSFIVGEYKP